MKRIVLAATITTTLAAAAIGSNLTVRGSYEVKGAASRDIKDSNVKPAPEGENINTTLSRPVIVDGGRLPVPIDRRPSFAASSEAHPPSGADWSASNPDGVAQATSPHEKSAGYTVPSLAQDYSPQRRIVISPGNQSDYALIPVGKLVVVIRGWRAVREETSSIAPSKSSAEVSRP
jgi:hypothetical protein